MKEYNYDEIRQMQEKALERVRDMQLKTHQLINGEGEKSEEQKNYRENFYNAVKTASKADYIKMPVEYPEEITNYESFEKYFGADSNENEETATQESIAESHDNTEQAEALHESVQKGSENKNIPLKGIADEPDKALLLSLLLLLQADNADEELLMSLLYIML